MKPLTPSFSWISWHLCYWKQSHFTLFAQVTIYERSRVRSLPRHTGGSFTVWRQDRLLSSRLAQAEAPNWIASGVILTCSLPVKSQMFWFILSPLFICLGLFSAMEGFSTEGLVKVGSVYTVQVMSRHFLFHVASCDQNAFMNTCTYSFTYAQLYKYCTVYSSLHLPLVICSITNSLLWVNIPLSFFIAWLKRHKK